MAKSVRMGWKVHTPNMLAEILKNPGMGIFVQPLSIFARLLAEVAERAIELDDPQLNILMMRLALYEQADPQKHTFEEIKAAYRAQESRL
jgi:hypothetical protein